MICYHSECLVRHIPEEYYYGDMNDEKSRFDLMTLHDCLPGADRFSPYDDDEE